MPVCKDEEVSARSRIVSQTLPRPQASQARVVLFTAIAFLSGACATWAQKPTLRCQSELLIALDISEGAVDSATLRKLSRELHFLGKELSAGGTKVFVSAMTFATDVQDSYRAVPLETFDLESLLDSRKAQRSMNTNLAEMMLSLERRIRKGNSANAFLLISDLRDDPPQHGSSLRDYLQLRDAYPSSVHSYLTKLPAAIYIPPGKRDTGKNYQDSIDRALPRSKIFPGSASSFETMRQHLATLLACPLQIASLNSGKNLVTFSLVNEASEEQQVDAVAYTCGSDWSTLSRLYLIKAGESQPISIRLTPRTLSLCNANGMRLAIFTDTGPTSFSRVHPDEFREYYLDPHASIDLRSNVLTVTLSSKAELPKTDGLAFHFPTILDKPIKERTILQDKCSIGPCRCEGRFKLTFSQAQHMKKDLRLEIELRESPSTPSSASRVPPETNRILLSRVVDVSHIESRSFVVSLVSLLVFLTLSLLPIAKHSKPSLRRLFSLPHLLGNEPVTDVEPIAALLGLSGLLFNAHHLLKPLVGDQIQPWQMLLLFFALSAIVLMGYHLSKGSLDQFTTRPPSTPKQVRKLHFETRTVPRWTDVAARSIICGTILATLVGLCIALWWPLKFEPDSFSRVQCHELHGSP